MTTRLRRKATRELTRMRLVLSPPRSHRGWFVLSLLSAGALAIGATRHYLHDTEMPWDMAPVASIAPPPDTGRLLEKRLEQMRLTLSVSEARGQELERQIDALNQRLRETQDELTFFRKAREGKH